MLSKLLTQHSTTYPSLSPRIMKTLLLALLSAEKKKATREGAIRGLMGIGKEAIRKGLVEGGGAKVVGSECPPGDQGPLVSAAMVRSHSGLLVFSADVTIRLHSKFFSHHRGIPCH